MITGAFCCHLRAWCGAPGRDFIKGVLSGFIARIEPQNGLKLLEAFVLRALRQGSDGQVEVGLPIIRFVFNRLPKADDGIRQSVLALADNPKAVVSGREFGHKLDGFGELFLRLAQTTGMQQQIAQVVVNLRIIG